MRSAFSILFFLGLVVSSQATKIDDFLAGADAFFKKHVKDGRVHYSAIKADHSALDKLIEQVAEMPLSNSPNIRSKVFLINAYNLYVIKDLARYYPVKSPKQIPGFFEKKRHEVAGRYYTLDDLEKTIMNGYKDPAVHFVLVKGAQGSPGLLSEALHYSKWAKQSKEIMQSALLNEQWLKLNGEDSSFQLNELVQWNQADFGKNDEEVLSFLNKYLPEEKAIPTGYTLSKEFLKFNWYLNK